MNLGSQSTRQVYIAWTLFQRRQVSMAPYYGFDTIFYPIEKRTGRLPKAFAYLRNSLYTMLMLARVRPRIVWIQLPQVPLLWIALLYRLVLRRDAAIIADCHNAMFRPPWSDIPCGLSLLSSCSVVLVHNSTILQTAAHLGVDPGCMLVVEDPPAVLRSSAQPAVRIDMSRPWFLFPASFASDEPIGELLFAAQRTPEVSVLITGDPRNCPDPSVLRNAPPNVRLLGYLTRSDFESLLLSVDAIIAFTRLEGLQLSVCGEAVGAGKPMILSGTQTLRSLFPLGAVYVDSSDPSSIAEGFRTMVKERSRLSKEIAEFSRSIVTQWQTRCRDSVLRRAGL